MAHSYTQVYLQCIFAVKYRRAVLTKDIRPAVQGVIGNLINETGCKTLIVNGIEDHIHCFLGLKPTVCISDLMQVVKGKSSKFINDNRLTPRHFEWQIGYGAFSYSYMSFNNVYNYVKNQEQHHHKEDFLVEYIRFLDKFEVDYEDQYIFEPLIDEPDILKSGWI